MPQSEISYQRTDLDKKKPKVLVALSGGVDSAVSAALLIQEGYEVYGAHMVCWDEGPECSSDQDRADAAKVASHLGIPFQVFDFRQEYKNQVVDYFYQEYQSGRTPNPDVACNREIKFGIFLKKAIEQGFDYIATGHYAQVILDKGTGRFRLLAGQDGNKDQSYFLYNLTQDQLKHTLFPIGRLTKPEVRALAGKFGLPNAAKKDSQGICFIGDVQINEFLRRKLKTRIGNVVNKNGRVLGTHSGIAFYTIGQREGLGISERIPHYVVAKQAQTNTLIAAPLGDSSHFSKELTAEKVNWISETPKNGQEVSLRVRYRQKLFESRIVRVSQKTVKLSFSEPQAGITPGQAVVIYQGAEILGGGIIQ